MSASQKEALSKWSPLVIAIISNLVIVAYGYGKMEQRIVPMEAHLVSDTTERTMAMFVTRGEYEQRIKTRDQEIAEMRTALRAIDLKIDRLLEHELGIKK